MAQLVLARQPLRERYLPADQIEIDIKKGRLAVIWLLEISWEKGKNRRRLRRHSETAKITQPRAKKQPSVKK
jgi:hypothetical protein